MYFTKGNYMDNCHCLYAIQRPSETGDYRCYYGVTHYSNINSPKKRFTSHRNSKYYLNNFLRKYPDAKMLILFKNLTKQQAYELEASLVPDDWRERERRFLLNECGGGYSPPAFNELSKEKQEKVRSIRSTNAKLKSNLKKGIEHSKSKPHRLISPEGKLFEGICVNLLCKEKGLSHPSIYRVLSGKKRSYKGWIKG